MSGGPQAVSRDEEFLSRDNGLNTAVEVVHARVVAVPRELTLDGSERALAWNRSPVTGSPGLGVQRSSQFFTQQRSISNLREFHQEALNAIAILLADTIEVRDAAVGLRNIGIDDQTSILGLEVTPHQAVVPLNVTLAKLAEEPEANSEVEILDFLLDFRVELAFQRVSKDFEETLVGENQSTAGGQLFADIHEVVDSESGDGGEDIIAVPSSAEREDIDNVLTLGQTQITHAEIDTAWDGTINNVNGLIGGSVYIRVLEFGGSQSNWGILEIQEFSLELQHAGPISSVLVLLVAIAHRGVDIENIDSSPTKLGEGNAGLDFVEATIHGSSQTSNSSRQRTVTAGTGSTKEAIEGERPPVGLRHGSELGHGNSTRQSREGHSINDGLIGVVVEEETHRGVQSGVGTSAADVLAGITTLNIGQLADGEGSNDSARVEHSEAWNHTAAHRSSLSTMDFGIPQQDTVLIGDGQLSTTTEELHATAASAVSEIQVVQTAGQIDQDFILPSQTGTSLDDPVFLEDLLSWVEIVQEWIIILAVVTHNGDFLVAGEVVGFLVDDDITILQVIVDGLAITCLLILHDC